jgi:hypothetical protein
MCDIRTLAQHGLLTTQHGWLVAAIGYQQQLAQWWCDVVASTSYPHRLLV